MSNFQNIPQEWATIIKPAITAESFVYDDPKLAGNYSRQCLEAWIYWIYEHDKLQIPYDKTIASLMKQPDFVEIINPGVLEQMHAIRVFGNTSSHFNSAKPKIAQAVHILKLLHGISWYFINQYGDDYNAVPKFDEEQIPLAQHIQKKILEEKLKEVQQILDSQKELVKQNEELQQQVAKTREENAKIQLPPKDPNEALTREIYIDQLLQESGWNVNAENVKEFPVSEMPNSQNLGFVDYVLWGENGKPIAVVEAKRTGRDAEVGRHQAELYAKALEKKYGQLPNVFLTNGYKIYFYDWEYPVREVFGFYTQDELQLNINRRISKMKIADVPVNLDISGRPYQLAAIKSVAERLTQKHRGALLVMATGTGKTRTAASLIDVLSKAGWVKRVLFLADRTALVTQAKASIAEQLPNMTTVNLQEEKENVNSRIVFSTYQTLINLIDQEKNENGRFYGVGHFDLIIFDEIHRSVYNKYKAIFDYFDGFKIGLTATPKENTDKNTYELFGLSGGNPTFNYDLEQAVKDGFLVNYKSYSVGTKFHREGIKYNELSEEDKIEYEEKFGDPITGEIPDEIEASALDNWLYNANTVDLILEKLMKDGIKAEGGNAIGKTIIFAKKHQHAEFIRERFNANYPHLNDQFLKVIDYQTEYKYDVLKDFKEKSKNPIIACSVDMLDTGIDVPEVVNLVFLKPIKSPIKFWQMIGRGTRLCKNLFGFEEDKTEFLILDFCENFEYFDQNPRGKDAPKQYSLNEKLFSLKLKISELLKSQDEESLQTFGQNITEELHQQVHQLFQQERDSFVVRRYLKTVEHYCDRQNWDVIPQEQIYVLNSEIAPLVFDEDKDLAAKQFDLLMFDLMLSHLNAEKRQINIIDRTKRIVEKLQKKTSIPQISAKLDLLKDFAKKDFWETISVHTIDYLRNEVRDLIKFLDPESVEIKYTNIEDEIFSVQENRADYGAKTFDKEAYKHKMEQYIKEHKTHLTIDKIRKNIQVTAGDIEVLEKMLFEQANLGNRKDFEEVFEKKPLGKIIREFSGMEKSAVQNVFADLINSAKLNTKQIYFLETIIEYFSQNGSVELNQLFESPFKEIDTQTIYMFDETERNQISEKIRLINRTSEIA